AWPRLHLDYIAHKNPQIVWITFRQFSILRAVAMLALTELLGEPVFDLGGSRCGRVRELALAPQEDHARIAMVIVRTKTGDRLLPFSSILSVNGGIKAGTSSEEWVLGETGEGLLLLSRDLLDQQVIDVFGRKVVRVNDVDLHHESVANRPVLKVGSEEVAAEALEEVDPKVQKAIVESLDSNRAAEIVEEMEPDAAADLLADLPEERTSEILLEMKPQERREMVELLEFGEKTAAGRMNTEYLAVNQNATVHDAIETLRRFQGGVETVSTIYLVDDDGKLAGAVPLAKLVLASPDTPLKSLTQEPLIYTNAEAKEKDF